MGTNTGIGIGIGIPFKNNALGGDRPYLPPELKARLIGVWDNYGKKNTDADRNIIKNKIPNAGGDLEILNAAYKLNSGFGEYKEDFTSWRIYPNIEVTDNVITTNGNFNSSWFIYKHADENEINEMNIKVSGIPEGGIIRYFYIPDETATIPVSYNISEDGVYHLPKSKLSSNRVSVGFTVSSSYDWNNIRIEQLSDFGGAFVTDGVNDIIISQKTLQEMGVTKDFTIVSMIHQISWRGSGSVPLTNYIRPTDNIYVRNQVADIGKTGIYGYVIYDVNNTSVNNSRIINTVLGDKNDYSIYTVGNLSQGKFSVQGYISSKGNIIETSRVAHYWTFALLGKATEDDINLIIGYFNLDRTLKADIYCNIEKQGLTNENHAEFGDKLIDYSGNGRDIQLNNISWNKESGINDDGALCLDGVTDYGKAVGLPIYKDYTFIIDREILSIDNIGIIASKSESAEDITKHGAFIFEYLTAPNVINTWSYYKNNTNIANTDFTRGISYQSKYNYNGKILTIGTSEDSDKLYLGTIRDNSDKYGNIAIYFLMSFPYSMNKFLIERQLKKYKAGTLYKDMVEFRPVIKSNIDINNIVYLDKDSNVVKVGDYISIGSNIKTSITVLDGYKISKVSSTAFNNITIEKSNTDFIYDVIFYGIKKSPQKINLVIEQDSDYVQWNPNIKANVSKYSVTANIRKTDDTILKLVNGQFYSTSITGNLILDIVPPYKDSDEVTNVVIDGKSYVPTKDSSGNYYRLEIPLVFPKEINITIQEYVRYEDIVQPYPVLLRFKDENNNEISWGDKIKLGSSITRIGSFNDCNLLKDIYTVSNAKLNGNPLPNTPHVVERQMIFTCTATWIFDDNEPNCILSPRLLRIPNSSYKILRHIPDISGHGNHGVIYNSAYAEGSGVNEDGSYQFDGVDDFIDIPTLSKGGKQVLMKVNWQKQDTMLYNQNPGQDNFAIFTNDYNNNNLVVAYASRNNGNTYIDGVVNNNILATQLKGITHNIVATNNNIDTTITPIIGSNKNHDNFFAQMSLYDFMLFDEISTDDKIKELNTYIGITPKVTLPNYYWDNYGKKNTDANRGHVDEQVSLQKTGTSVNPLENFNISYEGMSGYNGYPVVFGASKTWESLSGVYGYTSDVTNTTIHVTHAEHAGNSLLFSYVKKDGALANIKEIPAFRVTVGGLEGNSKFGYRYLATEDATEETLVYLGNGTHELAKSFAPTEALLDLTRNVWVGIFITPMIEGEVVFDCDITIEVLPEYENGLAYDGISDFSQNTEIEVVEDFTFLVKGSLLKGLTGSGGCIARKGDKNHYDTGGYAFIYCFDSPIESYRNSYYSFGKSFVPSKEIVAPPLIGYMTKTNVNGETTTFGTNSDIKGIIFGNWSSGYMNMVIYKSIFYTKTISLLEINFLKNLMEKDEIIDINHPIFISNTEDESNTSQDT